MGQLSSSRRGGGSILPPQHLCMWVGIHRETVMMTIDVTWSTCRLVAPYPSDHMLSRSSRHSHLRGTDSPSPACATTPGIAATTHVRSTPSVIVSHPPQLQYGRYPSALRAEAAITTPATSYPRLPGAGAGWRYAPPSSY